MEIEKLIKELENAKDDNKKFALLLILSQLIKTNKLETLNNSNELNERLFYSINPHFLARLLTSTQVPENCPKSIYKSVAMSILVQFNEYKKLATDPILITKVRQIFQILETSLDFVNEKDINKNNEEDLKLELNLIENIFKYLFALSKYCANHLCKNGLLDILINKILLNENSGYIDISIELLVKICDFDLVNNLECKDLINEMLKNFVNSINTNQTESKFALIKILNKFLNNFHHDVHLANINAYLINILKDTLKSRLKVEYKEDAFQHLNYYINTYQLTSIYRNSKEFFYLLIHLTTNEIRLQLEDNTKNLVDILNDQNLCNQICVYFQLLEKFIVYLSTSDDIDLSCEEDIKKSIGVLIETIKTVLVFIDDCLNDGVYESTSNFVFLIAAIRLIACWFAYEELLESEIVDYLNKFIKLFDFYMNSERSDSSLVLNNYKFLMPGLQRFLDNNKEKTDDLDDEEYAERLAIVCDVFDHCGKCIEKQKIEI